MKPARITPGDALRALGEGEPRYRSLLEHRTLEVEVYAPVGTDPQQPHDRDELYVIISGSGRFRRGGETVDFAPGDLLFVPAHEEHRFEDFDEGFATWVIFAGEPVPGPEDDGGEGE